MTPAKNRRLSPDKRWPGRWCAKARVWIPNGFSVEVVTTLHDAAGPVVLDLICRQRFSPAVLAALADLTQALARPVSA